MAACAPSSECAYTCVSEDEEGLTLCSLCFQGNMPQTPPFVGQLNSADYNKNLFQTSEESYAGLCYHDNKLVSGSLEALIQHLVPTLDYYPDVSVGSCLLSLLSWFFSLTGGEHVVSLHQKSFLLHSCCHFFLCLPVMHVVPSHSCDFTSLMSFCFQRTAVS